MTAPHSMRRAGGVLWTLAAVALLAHCNAADEAGVSNRNLVLLLTVDTLRPDYLSGQGYDRESSPFLDQLMQRGLVFEHAITPIARTTPALASLLTGEYPHTHGVRTLVQTLEDSQRSIAEAAHEAGYTTLAVVSNHILPPARGLDQGFDVYDFAGDRRGAPATTQAALDAVRAQPVDSKIFLWVHYIDPHVPYRAPPQYGEALDPGYTGRYAEQFGDGLLGNSAYPRDLGKVGAVFRNELPDSVNAHIRRLYAADIRQTDDAIRELLTGLEAARGDHWTVLFTSDHGEALGEQPFYFYDHGDYVTQGELKIPLAIVLPQHDPLARSGRSPQQVSLVDVAPTLAELLGLEFAPIGLHAGRSLVPALRDGELPAQPVFAESGHAYHPRELRRRSEFDVTGRFRSVIAGQWKLVFTPGLELDQAFELHDLGADPTEQYNLYRPTHPQAVRLRGLLSEWLVSSSPEPTAPPSAADLERLRSLGYLD